MEEENVELGGVLEGGLTIQQFDPYQNVVTITPAGNENPRVTFNGANNQPVEVIVNGNLIIDGNLTVNGIVEAYDFIIVNDGNIGLKNREQSPIALKSSLRLNLHENCVEFYGVKYTNPTMLGNAIFKEMRNIREQAPINSPTDFFEID